MSGESELFRQLEELRRERAAERAEIDEMRQERAAERAEMDEVRWERAAERVAREASEAAAKEAIDGRSEPDLQQPRVQGQQVEGYHSHTDASLFMSQNGMRVPKFIDGQTLHVWSSRLQDFLTARV